VVESSDPDENFSRWNDQQRIETLAPYGADWIVLPASMPTQFACPYQNSAVRVCHLPADIALLSQPSSTPAPSQP
jgi:chorismate-pyruvate lyase